MRFMNLPDEYSGKGSEVYILPISYEKDVTYGGGAGNGPSEILKASQHLEYYDEELDVEAFEKGIYVLDELRLSEKNPEEATEKIKERIIENKNKFIISLGGDHSVSIGIVKALEENEDFSVLVLDAHSDLRESWNNSKLNHACVSKRFLEKHKVGIIGVRSQDISEKEIVDNNEDVTVVYAHEFSEEKVDELLEKLGDKIYVSIDADVFDPSFIRNTGTPEPGGLSWKEVMMVLKKAFKKQVIGADIVEFAPKENYRAEAYALAKLVYKICGLRASYRSVS